MNFNQCNSRLTSNRIISSSSVDYLRPITGPQKNNKLVNQTRRNINTFRRYISPEHTIYSRKVFIGGLPQDIGENEIHASFQCFGNLIVDWPHKQETRSLYPPKGYAFLIFEQNTSVQVLISCCTIENEKFYFFVSSHSIRNKPVQIRPWSLSDSEFILDSKCSANQRHTIFVGGVPRPLKAFELAMAINKLFGGVCSASIDTDIELKYPKGAGRVLFSNQKSYVAAIKARFVYLQQVDTATKLAEVKPYVLDEQVCDNCSGLKLGGNSAPYFCANVSCLYYLCENCWVDVHSKSGMDFHKPLVKERTDRPRTIPYRWC